MEFQIIQRFPEIADQLPQPSRKDILNEKNFRRAEPDFVYRHGGDILKTFFSKADALGLITDNTRFMCQRSPIVLGAYPSPPNWHIDRMPGTVFNLSEHVTHPVQAAIACICSSDRIETTEFTGNGTLNMVEPEQTIAVHVAGQYLNEDEGLMNWTNVQVEDQISKGKVEARKIEANSLYKYDSTNFHRAPQFVHGDGYRIIMRLNTPPDHFTYEISTQNEIFPDEHFYFKLSSDGRIWKKYRL